jgi:hypothetical protein
MCSNLRGVGAWWSNDDVFRSSREQKNLTSYEHRPVLVHKGMMSLFSDVNN